MKRLLILFCLFAAISPVHGTNPGFGFLPQPINTGPNADPARIPLGPVPYYSNYGYGSTDVIHMSRKADHGGHAPDDGPDNEQNLAAAYGISIEPFDSTQFPIYPAILHVKAGAPPKSCPYTKEQVLIATIHCLLNYHGTKSRPIILRIEPEDAKDAHLLRYEGRYITGGDSKDEPVIKSRIPGSWIETSTSGIESVVFAPHLCQRTKTAGTPQPGFTPLLLGEYDGSGPGCWLVPTWPGAAWKEPANRLTFLPSSLVYQVYNGNGTEFTKANSLVAGSDFQTIAISGVKWNDSAQASKVAFDAEPIDELRDWFADTLSVTCQALVFSTRPVSSRPLTVAFSVPNEAAGLLKDFTTAPGWNHDPDETRTSFRCTFVCDPKTSKPTSGSIPGGTLEGLQFKSTRLNSGQ